MTKREAYESAHLAAIENSGLTTVAYARREGLSAKRLYQWRSRLRERLAPTRLPPMSVGDSSHCRFGTRRCDRSPVRAAPSRWRRVYDWICRAYRHRSGYPVWSPRCIRAWRDAPGVCHRSGLPVP